jgi:hypothetical protein
MLKGIADRVSGFRFAFFSWEDLPSIRNDGASVQGGTYRWPEPPDTVRSSVRASSLPRYRNSSKSFRDFVDVTSRCQTARLTDLQRVRQPRAWRSVDAGPNSLAEPHHAGAGRLSPVNISGKIVWLENVRAWE